MWSFCTCRAKKPDKTYKEVCLFTTQVAENENDGGLLCTSNFEVLLLCQKGKKKIFPSSKEKLRVVAAVENCIFLPVNLLLKMLPVCLKLIGNFLPNVVQKIVSKVLKLGKITHLSSTSFTVLFSNTLALEGSQVIYY